MHRPVTGELALPATLNLRCARCDAAIVSTFWYDLAYGEATCRTCRERMEGAVSMLPGEEFEHANMGGALSLTTEPPLPQP